MLSTIVFIALVAFTAWQLFAEYRLERAVRASDVRASSTAAAVSRFDPCTELPIAPATAASSPEGTIVARLLDGSIDRAQYRRAMTRLAVHDADAHPTPMEGR